MDESTRRSVRILALVCAGLVLLPLSLAAQDEGWITHHVAISPDLASVFLGSMHAEKGTSWLIARDAKEDVERSRISYAFGPVRDMAFSNDSSRIATTTGNGCIRIYDSRELRLLQEHAGHKSWVLSVALSPDGRVVASGGLDKTLRLRETETGDELWQATVDGLASALVFLPDGKTFAAAHQNGPINLWTTDGTKRSIGKSVPTTAGLAVSRDGKLLASIHRNGELRVWSMIERTLVWKATAYEERGYSVSFSPDGSQLATSGNSPTIKIWNGLDGKPAATLDAGRSLIVVRWGENRLVGADYHGNVQSWRRHVGDEGNTEWRKAPPAQPEDSLTEAMDSATLIVVGAARATEQYRGMGGGLIGMYTVAIKSVLKGKENVRQVHFKLQLTSHESQSKFSHPDPAQVGGDIVLLLTGRRVVEGDIWYDLVSRDSPTWWVVDSKEARRVQKLVD